MATYRPRKFMRQERHYVRFEVFTAVTMKNGVLWDVTTCGSCKNRCFGGTWRLPHQGDKNR
jgi:heterodisulfide reductase subunit C